MKPALTSNDIVAVHFNRKPLAAEVLGCKSSCVAPTERIKHPIARIRPQDQRALDRIKLKRMHMFFIFLISRLAKRQQHEVGDARERLVFSAEEHAPQMQHLIDADEVLAVADVVTVMRSGRVVATYDLRTTQVTQEQLALDIVGELLSTPQATVTSIGTEPILTVRNLTVTAEGRAVVTPMPRNLPDFTCGVAGTTVENIMRICPPSRSVMAGPVPL